MSSRKTPARLRAVPTTEPRLEFYNIHGYRRAYRIAGQGPAGLLIHGIGDNSTTWLDVIAHPEFVKVAEASGSYAAG